MNESKITTKAALSDTPPLSIPQPGEPSAAIRVELHLALKNATLQVQQIDGAFHAIMHVTGNSADHDDAMAFAQYAFGMVRGGMELMITLKAHDTTLPLDLSAHDEVVRLSKDLLSRATSEMKFKAIKSDELVFDRDKSPDNERDANRGEGPSKGRPTIAGLPSCMCGAKPGAPHESGCDVERCSVCGGQKLKCECKGHDPQFARWTGLWPGEAEALALGLYVDKQSGQQITTERETVAAEVTGDLNRFMTRGFYHVFFVKPRGVAIPMMPEQP